MTIKKSLLELTGSVERIVFRNDQNGYTVLELTASEELVTAVGIMPYVSVGEELKLLGTFKVHPSFGDQFNVEVCERSMPTTTTAILKYLSSGAIKGIGPGIASKLVEIFGEDTLGIIEKDPERLTIIKGISRSKAMKISEEFNRIYSIRELMISLGKYGITPDESIKVWKAYGNEAMETINKDPYLLCDERINVSFERADKIAASLEKPQDDINRIRAGVTYILTYNMNNGHTCLPQDKLEQAAINFLEVDSEKVEDALEALITEGALKRTTMSERDFIFTSDMYNAETYISGRLKLMMKFPPRSINGAEKYITDMENKNGITYANLQKKAISEALEKGTLVLTGGPGTGKTTTLNGIITILEQNGEKVFLAAPTGRAAQRMAAVTGKEAKTIHRMLGVEWDSQDKPIFKKNEKDLLDCDALILDEVSMVDVKLFDAVLRALPLGCRLILVGDSNQLPSVGPGNILSDLINSEMLPIVQLKEIFRQSMESMIVMNAHKIINGELPDLSVRDNDFFFINKSDAHLIGQTIKDLCESRLPKAYGYNSPFDIQVISPGKKGELGTININKILQSALNPKQASKKELNINGNLFRQGDKVMQIKNNYNIPFVREDSTIGEGIFNGDIGILIDIDKSDSTVIVKFDDKYAKYNFENVNDLDLAYAITVHKSQGSEFEAVVMPMYYGAPQLYYRNLLYTGVTRAKSLLVLVGMPWTVQKMVENNKKNLRYSGLCSFFTRESE